MGAGNYNLYRIVAVWSDDVSINARMIPMKNQQRTNKRSPRAKRVRTLATIGAILFVFGACSGDDRDAPDADDRTPAEADQSARASNSITVESSVDDVLTREHAAALFRQTSYIEARELLAPLAERESPALEDWLRLVNVELALQEIECAENALNDARAIAPNDPVVLWSAYRIASFDGDYDTAIQTLRELEKVAPNDVPARLALANLLAEIDEDEEAESRYRALLAEGGFPNEGWRLTTTYRLFSFLGQRGRVEDALPLQSELQRFEESGVPHLRADELERGTFGDVAPPPRGELRSLARLEDRTSVAAPDFAARVDAPFSGSIGIVPVARHDHWAWTEALWQDEWIPREAALQKDPTEKSLLVTRVESMPVEILCYGPGGAHLARFADDDWSFTSIFEGAVSSAAPLDLDLPNRAHGAEPSSVRRDGLIDFAIAGPDGLVILAAREETWEPLGESFLDAEFVVRDLAPLDYDHDGDLDLLVVGSGGVRLFRNDGLGAPKGGLVEVTVEAGLPREREFHWCVIEDPDGDNDVDVVLGGGAVFVGSNARGGRFVDRTGDVDEPLRKALLTEHEPVLADLDADGWTDIVADGRLYLGDADFRFTESEHKELLAQAAASPVHAATPLGRAAAQVVSSSAAKGIVAHDALGRATQLVGAQDALGGQVACADVDGDGLDDLVESNSEHLGVHRNVGEGHAITLSLQGVKDNRRAVGALVELRAGARYRRLYWRGEPRVIGLGEHDVVDILRVTWPNGIVQEVMDLDCGSYVVRQREGLGGSCPFLYTWNGEEYTFVSDVLGITPLGLPMGPGLLVPPDHDEYVLIRGDQLRPRDGFFELQFTEELREVTYLDRVRLEVLDHPVGTEVYPNELFSFPPFPEAHLHTVETPVAPKTAIDGLGEDWTTELIAIDGEYAIPFRPLFGQYLGLAEPHELVLEFDSKSLIGAGRLRLVMTGWFYWTDASVNIAAARHPDIEFMPPVLSVPDGNGDWRDTGPPIGFPAGKLKTMVIDVTDSLNRDDPRVRLSGTLQLYWDSIRLAVGDDRTGVRVTELEPDSAELWSRGFSEPQTVMGISGMDWFEWDKLASQPRWNQHPGLYTAYGETLPLVSQVDDQFVIMGAGDALHVRFDASSVPELEPGYVRDYQLYLDGWAKDRDPNTVEALNVEPLPFHGMSAYPYEADESFPEDAEHLEWKVRWNTRLSRRWLESLVPR